MASIITAAYKETDREGEPRDFKYVRDESWSLTEGTAPLPKRFNANRVDATQYQHDFPPHMKVAELTASGGSKFGSKTSVGRLYLRDYEGSLPSGMGVGTLFCVGSTTQLQGLHVKTLVIDNWKDGQPPGRTTLGNGMQVGELVINAGSDVEIPADLQVGTLVIEKNSKVRIPPEFKGQEVLYNSGKGRQVIDPPYQENLDRLQSDTPDKSDIPDIRNALPSVKPDAELFERIFGDNGRDRQAPPNLILTDVAPDSALFEIMLGDNGRGHSPEVPPPTAGTTAPNFGAPPDDREPPLPGSSLSPQGPVQPQRPGTPAAAEPEQDAHTRDQVAGFERDLDDTAGSLDRTVGGASQEVRRANTARSSMEDVLAQQANNQRSGVPGGVQHHGSPSATR